jgi:hypothetical protein
MKFSKNVILMLRQMASSIAKKSWRLLGLILPKCQHAGFSLAALEKNLRVYLLRLFFAGHDPACAPLRI